MDALRHRLVAAIAALALVTAAPAHADPLAPWRRFIVEASARFAIPARWIERVILAESGGHTMLNGRPITSPAGAIGLMQLMPDTWSAMRRRYRLGRDPRRPHDNILAGTAYLRAMYDRFGYPGCFAAYNAGPGRYAAYLAGRASLPNETLAYLDEVAPDRIDARYVRGGVTQNPIFIALQPTSPHEITREDGSPQLFVPLRTARQSAAVASGIGAGMAQTIGDHRDERFLGAKPSSGIP